MELKLLREKLKKIHLKVGEIACGEEPDSSSHVMPSWKDERDILGFFYHLHYSIATSKEYCFGHWIKAV